jgi:hypothetical protein
MIASIEVVVKPGIQSLARGGAVGHQVREFPIFNLRPPLRARVFGEMRRPGGWPSRRPEHYTRWPNFLAAKSGRATTDSRLMRATGRSAAVGISPRPLGEGQGVRAWAERANGTNRLSAPALTLTLSRMARGRTHIPSGVRVRNRWRRSVLSVPPFPPGIGQPAECARYEQYNSSGLGHNYDRIPAAADSGPCVVRILPPS